jgi:hypothetical protein
MTRNFKAAKKKKKKNPRFMYGNPLGISKLNTNLAGQEE